MKLLQRIADVITRPPPRPEPELPPPIGALELERALHDLDDSTEELRRRINRPVPSLGSVFVDMNRQGERGR